MDARPGTSGTVTAPTVAQPAVGAVPCLASGVEVLGPLSGSGYRDAPTLVRRGDGQTLQVTPMLAALLELIDGNRDEEALAEALSERLDRRALAEDVHHLIEKKLRPLGLLHDESGEAPDPVLSNPLLALRFKVVASRPEVTRRITAPFAWLFHTAFVVPTLIAFGFVCWWVLAEKGLASATHSAFYDPPMLLAILGLTVVSAGWHEFGHAAACRYGGATPGAMGAGLYIVWPAFYTDVNDSYRLSRWGRLRVDLGGLYFNALIAVGVAGWWWFTRQDALLLAIGAQLLQMLRQLAPYIRADGYHILADLTGVPDLFAHMKPTLLGLLPWRWGKSPATGLKPWARLVIIGWVLLVMPMLVGMFLAGVLLLPRIISTAWDSGGRQAAALTAAWGDGDVLEVLARSVSMVALALPVVAVSYLLLRFLRRTPLKIWHSTEGRPAMRGLALVAATALLMLVGSAWWPDGQYRPVQANERGTLGDLVGSSRTVVVPAETRARATPMSALALVPKSGDHPAMLLVDGEDGLRSIYTDGTDGGSAAAGTAAPFALPDPPAEGDNQAVAVNTEDGTVEYDVAVALVWVTDGDPALNTNSAYALASCTGCTTVAVAFQVVLVVGQTDVVAPTNAAVAGNRACLQCTTAALAAQLVVTLQEMPTDEVKAQIEAAMSKLDGLEELTATLDLGSVYEQIKAVEAEVVSILVTNGLVDESMLAQVTATTAASASSSPDASATGDPSATPSAEDSTSPSASESAESSPSPSESASPSPSDSPTP